MKEFTSIFITLVLGNAAIAYLPNGMSHFKSINQALTIPCHCEEALQCRWYYQDQQAVPDNWVQENGDLYLPAGDWNVYGGITCYCGSDSNAYTVMNPGEVCDICLQLYFTSLVDDICVGSVANVAVSTNQSHSHGDAITLHVNDSVCSSVNHGNDVVRCHEHGSVIGHTLSYTITAINVGTVTIRAITTYYGATWYSMLHTITVVEQCNESAPTDIITTPDTSVSTTDVTTAAPSGEVTTNDNTSSKEVPTDSIDDSSSGGAVPEEPTSKVNMPGNKDGDESAKLIIVSTCMCILNMAIMLAIVVCCCWKCRKRNKLPRKQTQGQQSALVSLSKLITGLPSCKDSSQEDYCC